MREEKNRKERWKECERERERGRKRESEEGERKKKQRKRKKMNKEKERNAQREKEFIKYKDKQGKIELKRELKSIKQTITETKKF